MGNITSKSLLTQSLMLHEIRHNALLEANNGIETEIDTYFCSEITFNFSLVSYF